MSLKDVLITNIISLNQDHTVAQAVAILRQYHISSAPVVDSNGVYIGKFGYRCIIRALLPAAATMEGGLGHLDFLMGAMPGVAKKLKKIEKHLVSEFLDTSVEPETLNTSLPEAMLILSSHGGSLPIVDPTTKKLVGVLSTQSVLSNLENLYVALSSRPDEINEDDLELLRKHKVIN